MVCPRCGQRARVRSIGNAQARLSCPHCALSREWREDALHVLIDDRRVVLRRDHGAWLDPTSNTYVKTFRFEDGIERRFGTPLWLRTECCGGHLLWANNTDHLAYLERYVAAGLRERPPGPAPLSWKLPAWMKDAKNRQEVLRAMAGRSRLE